MKEAKQYYLALKNSGELNEVFPESKGSWEEDSKLFTEHYNISIKTILDFENSVVDIDDEEEDEYGDIKYI